MKRPQLPRRRKPRFTTRPHSYTRTQRGAMLAAGSTLGELELEFANEPTKTSASRPVPDNKLVRGVPDTNQLQDESTAT